MTNDDETAQEELDEGEVPPEPPVPQEEQPPEAVNLVPGLMADPVTAEWLLDAAKKLCRQVRADDESRADWLQARADELKLFAGDMEQGRSGGLEPHNRISTRILLQLWSRGWDGICPAKGTLMQCHPNGPSDEMPAQRREKYMNWQLRHRVPNWIMGHGQSYLGFLQSGSRFREKSWNPYLRTTEFDDLGADDVIVAYSEQDTSPLMTKVARVTRVLRLYRWDMENLADAGMFDEEAVEKIFHKDTGSIESEPEVSVVRETGMKIDGVEPPSATMSKGEDKDLAQRALYRSQTWLKFPGEKKAFGNKRRGKKMRPVMFTCDRKTGIPVALTIREDQDPFDVARFERDQKAWDIAAQNVANQYQQAVQQAQVFAQQGLQAPPPPKPNPPPAPRPVRMRVLHSFVHYRLFPNPAGFYGIGVGYLLKNANLLINKLEAEYLQSARLSNTKGGWLPANTLAKRGVVEAEMGKYTETLLEADQMAGIRDFNFSPPADGLWKFIQKVVQDCGTLIADVDTMSGEAGPTNETKAAAEQRQFNANTLTSVIQRLYLEPLKEEIKLLAHDNRTFMDDTEEFYITEQTAEGERGKKETVERSDFKDEFDFTFTADQRLQSQPERIQTLSNVITQLLQIPLAQDPARGPQLFYVAMQKLFRALDMPEFEQALGSPPPPPQPPQAPTPMSQADENKGFFSDQDHPVLPDDDDQNHLYEIAVLRGSPYFAMMPPTGKQMLDRHEAAHAGQLYAKMGGQPNGMGAGQGMDPGRGNGAPAGGVGVPPAELAALSAQQVPNGGQPPGNQASGGPV